MVNQYNKCEKENLIRQLIKVQAQISVIPEVRHGTPKVYCLDSCIKPNPNNCDKNYYDCECCEQEYCDYRCSCHKQSNCDCCENDYDDYCCENTDYYSISMPNHRCNYTLTLVACIEIPISIDADVNIKEGIACCGKPEILSTDNMGIENKKPFYRQMI